MQKTLKYTKIKKEKIVFPIAPTQEKLSDKYTISRLSDNQYYTSVKF